MTVAGVSSLREQDTYTHTGVPGTFDNRALCEKDLLLCFCFVFSLFKLRENSEMSL